MCEEDVRDALCLSTPSYLSRREVVWSSESRAIADRADRAEEPDVPSS